MTTYQIITLSCNVQSDGTFNVTGLFWLTAPSNLIIPQPNIRSQFPNITTAEYTALQSGTIVEQFFVTSLYASGTILSTVQTDLQSRYTSAQSSLTSSGSGTLAGLVGVAYNGTSWSTPSSTIVAQSNVVSGSVTINDGYSNVLGISSNPLYVTGGGGGGTSNQGTANTLANAWSMKITDATNGPAAVKPASTAAVAADPALVVALSPNNSITTSSAASYGSNNQSITITIAGLVSLAQRASTAVDNTSNKFRDTLVQITVKTNSTGTATTGIMNIYAYGTVDGGTTYGEGATGTDAAITLTVPPNLKLIGTINTVANSTTYKSNPMSVSAAFNGRLPDHWGVVVENKSGAALDSTAGNFKVAYQGIN